MTGTEVIQFLYIVDESSVPILLLLLSRRGYHLCTVYSTSMNGTVVRKYGAVIGSLDAIVIVVLEDDDSKTTVALTSER